MDDKEIKKILENLNIPKPGEKARNAALERAMAEFNRQQEAEKIKVKGTPGLGRLTGRLREKIFQGGPVMTRRLTLSAGIALSVLLLAIIAGPRLFPKVVRGTSIIVKGPERVAQIPTDEKEPLIVAKADERIQTPPVDKKAVPPVPPPSELTKSEDVSSVSALKAGKGGQGKESVAIEETAAGAGSATADGQHETAQARPHVDALLAEKPAAVMEESLEAALPAPSEQRAMKRMVLPGTPARDGYLMYESAAIGVEAEVAPQRQEYFGRDQFEKITPNPVKLVKDEPVSTFSIDVDTASYAFVRRALNGGVLPQKDAVRVEELINYFKYDYEVPKDAAKPFKPTVAVYPTPWHSDTRLLHIGIKGHEIVPEQKPRANLVFLIDVSGSMSSQDKLPLLKNSFRLLVDTLDDEDVVSIVVYAGAAGTVLEPTKVKDGGKGRILAALERLHSGGSTAGGEGIRQAYALAEANLDADGVNRVILATDGDFNVGITNRGELKGFVEREREKGIFLSVLGFGQGNYNDAMMQALAQNGNGNAAYIDTLSEARKVLVEEAGSTLFTIARDVKIQVEFNPEMVAEYRLIGYETRMLAREDFNNDKVDAGDVGSGHSVTAIYEITPADSAARLVDDLRYGKDASAETSKAKGDESEYAFLKIRYKLPDESKSRLMTTPIDKKNEYRSVENAPQEIRFAASVAAFGQLLRGGKYTKDFSYDDVIALAEPARGRDPFGYRSEFVNLLRLAKTARSLPTQ